MFDGLYQLLKKFLLTIRLHIYTKRHCINGLYGRPGADRQQYRPEQLSDHQNEQYGRGRLSVTVTRRYDGV